jgi:branched-chain amino acid aminotransferase
MYRAYGDSSREPVWDEGEFVQFGDITVSPAAAFMSYGLGIFEGLKAQRTEDGRVLLFRVDRNAERMQSSAERLLMAAVPCEQFIEACVGIVSRNIRFVPPAGKGALYLRPIEHAIEPKLGLGPCSKFSFLVYASPVGSYFSGAGEGVRLQVLRQGRVAPGGTGYAKAMGNYAGGIYVAAAWRQKGFDDVLYLDAHEQRYVTETSGSNVFLVRKDGTIVTPPLDDQILPGVTRESTVAVARDILGLTVEERPLPIEEVIEEGVEVFCTGTAWTIQNVKEIVHEDRTHSLPESRTCKELLEILRGIQTGAREDPFGWTTEIQ